MRCLRRGAAAGSGSDEEDVSDSESAGTAAELTSVADIEASVLAGDDAGVPRSRSGSMTVDRDRVVSTASATREKSESTARRRSKSRARKRTRSRVPTVCCCAACRRCVVSPPTHRSPPGGSPRSGMHACQRTGQGREGGQADCEGGA